MGKIGGNTDTESPPPHLADSQQQYQPPEVPTQLLLTQPPTVPIAQPPTISPQSHRSSRPLPHLQLYNPRRDPHTKPQITPRHHQPNSLRSSIARHPARDTPRTLRTNRARLSTSQSSVVGSSPIKLKPKRPPPLPRYPLKHHPCHQQPNSRRSTAERHPARDNLRALRINPPRLPTSRPLAMGSNRTAQPLKRSQRPANRQTRTIQLA